MLYQKIVLAGGSGYLGTVLAGYYRSRAKEVIILSRKPRPDDGNISTVVWDARTTGSWLKCLEGADMLINLCGKNVNCRYTPENKKAIVLSRTVPTRLLGEAIALLQQPPQLWINVTSATIYRHAEDRPQDELTGETGYGFSVDVCNGWEESFWQCATPATRKVALRMGIVLGRRDGAFPRLLNLVKMGFGGRQGNGSQYIGWVHEQDAARATEWLLQHPALSGIFNCTAPGGITNSAFMRLLRETYGIRAGLPLPQWLLETGARLAGTETELLLKSRWVYPRLLEQAGFRFAYADAAHAVHDLLATVA
ncbi:TIGR01777 family oxidoreductase [Deminuibacter soli]|uniref:TIGR01777 family protein n=1 Tax=Deminuibacter soli TaxID=2291815 RepID=A0A3E1NQ90_9BACT|nr:TIGR01777 family oxidoreductase [Deminuibacter soli]RFM30096.1 TIGR01777 family protein [Deminuibacter soli]